MSSNAGLQVHQVFAGSVRHHPVESEMKSAIKRWTDPGTVHRVWPSADCGRSKHANMYGSCSEVNSASTGCVRGTRPPLPRRTIGNARSTIAAGLLLLLLLEQLLLELLLLRRLYLHASFPQLSLDVLHQQVDGYNVLSSTRNDDVGISLGLQPRQRHMHQQEQW